MDRWLVAHATESTAPGDAGRDAAALRGGGFPIAARVDRESSAHEVEDLAMPKPGNCW